MRTLQLFLLLLCYGFITAQIDAYDISSYVTPDFSYSALSLSPSISGNSGSSNQKRFEARARSSFFHQKYSRQRISELNFSFTTENERSQSISDTTRNWSTFGSLAYNNNFFYKDRRFITLDGEGEFFHIDVKDTETEGFIAYSNLSLKPHWGMGRIELVTDAWHATAILTALKDKGLLTAEPDLKQIEALAQAVTAIKNNRVLDFRFERIYEMEQLAAYLGESGYVETDKFAFFAALNDAWLFEGFRNRRSGSTWQIGPTGKALNARTSTALIVVSAPGARPSNTKNWTLEYGLETIYEKYIPKGNFQIDFSTGLMYGRAHRIIGFENADDVVDNYEILSQVTSLDIDYLLSSRINMGIALVNEFIDTSFQKFDNFSRVDLDFQYFVAPRASISANARLSLQKREREDLRDSSGFIISLDYLFL